MKINNRISRGALPRTNNMQMLELMESKGIYFAPGDLAIFDHPQGEKSIVGMDTRLAMDADTWSYGNPSNGVPYQFLTEYTRKPIQQILLKRAYMDIGKEYQMGSFSTQRVEIALQNLIGYVTPYGDYNDDAISDANYTWSPRDLYLGQTVIQYGDLEVEAGSSAKLDIIGGKRYSAAQSIAIAENKLFFLGNVTSGGAFVSKTFGLLNDPGLNASYPAPNGNWGTSGANQATNIINDINFAFQKLATQLGNNVTQESKLLLAVSAEAGSYFGTPTTLGITVAAMISSIYKNIRIVYAPEYKTLTSGTDNLGGFQLIAEDCVSEGAVGDLFSYKYRSHGTVRKDSSYREKISFGSGGAAVFAPAGVVTVTGL